MGTKIVSRPTGSRIGYIEERLKQKSIALAKRALKGK